MQKHLQAPAAVGCSSLAWPPKEGQGLNSSSPWPTTLSLPRGHLPMPQNIVIWGTKHLASSRASTRNYNSGSTKWHRRRCIYREPTKLGRNMTTKMRFLWEAQSRTLFGKAPLRKPRKRTCYKSKSSHRCYCQACRVEISLEEKQTPWQLFIATQTSSHLVFCWCNTDHMCLQARERKATSSIKEGRD